MGAENPNGSQKYAFNGLPFAGVEKSGAATGAQKFAFNGLPAVALFPAAGGAPAVVSSPVGVHSRFTRSLLLTTRFARN